MHGGRLLGAGGPLAADRRHEARAAPLRRDGRRGGCGEQRAPRPRRRPAARPVGVARRLLGGTWPRHRHARPRVRHPRTGRLPASEPAARDRRGLGRPDRGRVGRRARRDLGADPRGAVVHAAPAEVAAHAPWAAAAIPAGHARGALRSALGRARAPLVRDERARVGSLGGGRDPRGSRRRRRSSRSSTRSSSPRRSTWASRFPLLQGSSARTSGSASQRLRCSGSVARRGSRSRSACRPSGTCRRRSSAR